jgi:hypothetical protein
MVLSRCYHTARHIAESSIAETGLCLSDFVALEALLHSLNNVIGEHMQRHPDSDLVAVLTGKKSFREALE